MPFWLTALFSMLVVLGIMVLVHEFGHFAVAKLFGVRVEVFSVGFGKRLIGYEAGGTDYRISILPLGGYVKMAGENPNEEVTGDPGEFAQHPRWQRIMIGLAGPFANFVLAFVLMTGYYMMHNEVYLYLSQPAVVDWVPQNTPAARAGLQAGDRFVHFDGVDSPTWDQVRIQSALNLNRTVPVTVERNGQIVNTQLQIEDRSKGDDFDVDSLGLLPVVQPGPVRIDPAPGSLDPVGFPAERAGLKPGDVLQSVDGHTFHFVQSLLMYLQEVGPKPIHLTVLRGDQTLDVTLTPTLAESSAGKKEYRLGFKPALPPYKVEQMSLFKAMGESYTFNKKNSSLIVDVLHRMLTRRMDVQTLSGPIGISRQTGTAFQMPGWQPKITLMAVISLNLGIFNLLPIPILDGGLILLLLIEGLIRRDINQEFKERIYQVAFVVLVLFAVFVMFNDMSKLPLFSRFRP